MKIISKSIFAILGCSTAFALGEEASLPAPAVSPENNPLIDLGSGADMQLPPTVPDIGPVPEVPLPETPRTVTAGQTDRKWKVIPFAGFEVSWTDNLFISATKRRSDFFTILSPGLAVGWGDYGGEIRQLGSYEHYFEPLNLDPENTPKNFIFGKYNANASFFFKNDDQNSVDHDALIEGRWEGARLTVGGRFYFQTLSDRDIEVGNRVDRTVYGGEVTSSYSYSDKTSIELNFYNRSFDYAKQLDWEEWITEGWLNYQAFPKTKISFGTRLGLARVQSSPTQKFEQMVGRVAYFPGTKLGFSLDGGLEWRQYGGGTGDEFVGVFNFSATYAPFDGTQMAIKSYRRNSASVVQSEENITATGFSALVQQRFLQRYYFAVEGGYEYAGYRSRRAGTGSDRQDETTYLKASVSFDVTKFLSAEVAYQHRHNDSSRTDLSFDENVFSLLFKLRL